MSAIRIAGAAALTLAVSTGALAQSKTWNFADSTAPGSCGQTVVGTNVAGASNIGNTYGCSVQPGGASVSLDVNAWNVSAAGSTAGTFAKASVGQWSGGMGVGNVVEGGAGAGSPEHSMDNINGTSDALLLHFTSGAEALSQVKIGWTSGDSDFQVLKYSGADPTTNLVGMSVSSALASGWSLVASLGSNAATPANTNGTGVYNFNTSGTTTSSWWLITAFNSAFGGTNFDSTTDAMKVLAIGTGRIPEPMSLALVGIALGGAAIGRRRATAKRA